jgi:hypothetical protein
MTGFQTTHWSVVLEARKGPDEARLRAGPRRATGAALYGPIF